MLFRKRTVEQIQHDLELNEEIKLHEKGWVIQRVGWVILLLVVLAGAVGVFGSGFLSKRSPVAGGIKVEYERFFRYETEMKILVQSSAEPITTISFPQSYLKDFRLIRFVPEPHYNQSTPADVLYYFQGGQNQIVSVYLIPKDYGPVKGDMRVNNNHIIHLDHFIYP